MRKGPPCPRAHATEDGVAPEAVGPPGCEHDGHGGEARNRHLVPGEARDPALRYAGRDREEHQRGGGVDEVAAHG